MEIKFEKYAEVQGGMKLLDNEGNEVATLIVLSLAGGSFTNASYKAEVDRIRQLVKDSVESYREPNTHAAPVKPGYYRHSKGGVYKVIGYGVHSETKELLVQYHKHDDNSTLWLRPASMWHEIVRTSSGDLKPRFAEMSETEYKAYAGKQ